MKAENVEKELRKEIQELKTRLEKILIYLNLDENANTKNLQNVLGGVIPMFHWSNELAEKALNEMDHHVFLSSNAERCDTWDPFNQDRCLFTRWLSEVFLHNEFTPFCYTKGKRYKLFTNEWTTALSPESYRTTVIAYLTRSYKAFFCRVHKEFIQSKRKSLFGVTLPEKTPKFQPDMSRLMTSPFRRFLKLKNDLLIANYELTS